MSARFGFRTDKNASPINIIDGIDLVKKFPFDGPDGHAKLELKLRVAFPQPDIHAERDAAPRRADDDDDQPTRAHEVFLGMGDLEIDLDELNLCLDW